MWMTFKKNSSVRLRALSQNPQLRSLPYFKAISCSDQSQSLLWRMWQYRRDTLVKMPTNFCTNHFQSCNAADIFRIRPRILRISKWNFKIRFNPAGMKGSEITNSREKKILNGNQQRKEVSFHGHDSLQRTTVSPNCTQRPLPWGLAICSKQTGFNVTPQMLVE